MDGTMATGEDEETATGAASAIGTVAKNAKVSFQIYNADGTRATFAGMVLDPGSTTNNEIIALFARAKQGSIIMGNLVMKPNGTKNSLSGDVKFLGINAINQDREVEGATFVPPTVGTLPLSSFPFNSNNMVKSYTGGSFDGVYKVATWMPTAVSVPVTENERAKVTYDHKTGLMTSVYTLTDVKRVLNQTSATAYAVTVDGLSDMIGSYIDATSTGLFLVEPNQDGLLPVGSYGKISNGVTLNSAGKDVPKAGLSYPVAVAGTGDWKVVIPPDANWLSVTIINKNGVVSLPLTGNGNADVMITAGSNPTSGIRSATITIGGVKHTIRQARY
jgi:hypothetical protein